jgi:predicted DNA-binding antitoxin AbrB/MazE fold protein
MSPQPITFEGVFKDGVLVPASPVKLPEGVTLTIAVFPPAMDPDLQAETADWERLSDEAWAMIDDWEREG